MTNKTKTRFKTLAFMAALVAVPQLAGADAPAKAACSCCAKGDPAGQGNLIGSVVNDGKTIQLADAGSTSLPKDSAVALDSLVAIQKSLAADSMSNVSKNAKAIAKAAGSHKVHGLPHEAAAQAEAVAKATDIKAARGAFKKLNASFETYLKKHPDTSGTYKVAYCPMAKASWVQKGSTIANPYFGSKMLKCGSIKH